MSTIDEVGAVSLAEAIRTNLRRSPIDRLSAATAHRPVIAELLLKLAKAPNFDFVVVGSVAGALRGAPFACQDLDIVVRITAENVDHVAHVLTQVGLSRWRGGAVWRGDLQDDAGYGYVFRFYGPSDVTDVDLHKPKMLSPTFEFDDVVNRSTWIKVGSHLVRVAQIDIMRERAIAVLTTGDRDDDIQSEKALLRAAYLAATAKIEAAELLDLDYTCELSIA